MLAGVIASEAKQSIHRDLIQVRGWIVASLRSSR
jgi:hypothetical protein